MPEPIKVLLVDDEAAFLEIMTKLLVRRGLLVTCAADGEQAVRIAEREEFDAIVLDLRMPCMDGLETLKRLREKDPLTPMLFLSGQGDLSSVREAMKGGAVDFFTKPCQAEALLAAIEDASEKKRYAKKMG